MSRIILITGGSRSGKSAYAQRLAESYPGPKAFIATCPVLDKEMARRIQRHQADRSHDPSWHTWEASLHLEQALQDAQGSSAILVDCLTLWVNNLLHEAILSASGLTEDSMAAHTRRILSAARASAETSLFITNEVGMGIIPDNPLARQYQDLLGRCNQVMAAGADEVLLMSCGLTLKIKG
jgi:adenosylcobinamide kinase/adenosylcobinamide-phosphate guanylyltransferase